MENQSAITVYKSQGYWERVQQGREYIPAEPSEIMKEAYEYFQWADENPIIINKVITSGTKAGMMAYETIPRPYSLRAFCMLTGLMEEQFKMWKDIKDINNPYYTLALRIIQLVYLQNYELVIAGVYNPNFIKSALEKVDEMDNIVRLEIVEGLPPLVKSEIEVLESIKIKKGEVVLEKGKLI